MEKKSNISTSTKISESTYEIKLDSNETFLLEMKISEKSLLIKCKNSKIPYPYENLVSYDSLLSIKQLKIYDNIQEIYEFFIQKLEKNECLITEKKNEVLIEFLINYEKNIIPVPINLTRNDNVDLNSVVLDLIKYNTSMEKRLEILEKSNLALEKKVEILEKSNLALEEKITNILSFWGAEPIKCWKCMTINIGGGNFRKKKYTKNDGRCDGFVLNGYWGVCVKCDPTNNYQN